MSDRTQHFETPENVAVSYTIAGAGSRFLAHLFDLLLLMVGFIILALIVAALLVALTPDFSEFETDRSVEAVAGIVLFAAYVAYGFSTFLYFGLFELFMRGQTPGKRLLRLRVVGEGGFSLTFLGVFTRNLFRIIDEIPILWIVPVLTRRCQRFGDMVAGTLVVSEDVSERSSIRHLYAERRPEESEFAFSGTQLEKLREDDLETVETLLERMPVLPPELRDDLLSKVAMALSIRLDVRDLEQSKHLTFLEDLLAAYARREARELG